MKVDPSNQYQKEAWLFGYLRRFRTMIRGNTQESPSGQIMTLESLLARHDIKPSDKVFVEEWTDGIFIRKQKATIWDFVGNIKATGSVEEERESMIEAAIAHAIGEDEKA
jgi:hypothetical protein